MLTRVLRFFDPRGWAAVAGALIVMVLILMVASRCTHDARRDAREARGAQAIAEAARDAAGDANAIRDRSDARSQAIDNQTEENRDAILNAPGADQRIDPALNAAFRRSVCMRHASADLPECRAMLQPDPR